MYQPFSMYVLYPSHLQPLRRRLVAPAGAIRFRRTSTILQERQRLESNGI